MGACSGKSTNPPIRLEKSDTVITNNLPAISTGTDKPKTELKSEGFIISRDISNSSKNSNKNVNNLNFNNSSINGSNIIDSSTSDQIANDDLKVSNLRIEHQSKKLDNLIFLHEINPADITNLPFKNQIQVVFVCDVYDGDTCTILYSIDQTVLKTNLRILGIDAPEFKVKSKDKTNRDLLEEEAGAKVREIVKNLIWQKYTQVKFVKHDKFGGRILAEVYIPNEIVTITDFLLNLRYAKPYAGQKKIPWTEEELYYILYN